MSEWMMANRVPAHARILWHSTMSEWANWSRKIFLVEWKWRILCLLLVRIAHLFCRGLLTRQAARRKHFMLLLFSYPNKVNLEKKNWKVQTENQQSIKQQLPIAMYLKVISIIAVCTVHFVLLSICRAFLCYNIRGNLQWPEHKK